MIPTPATDAHRAGHRMVLAGGALAAGVWIGLTVDIGSSLFAYGCAVVLGVCALVLRGRAPWTLLVLAVLALGIGRAQ